ncbi:MAG: substrate-binding domain-containing protein [Lachnospiraceae bacterium]|nr:substrate-binding domain-containing protein [Lachnospiraceae bacterium]
MKKIIALITVLAMCVGILAACGGSGGGDKPAGSGGATPAAADGQLKVGIILYDDSGQWAKDIVASVKVLADALGVKIETAIGGTDPSVTKEDVQNFGAAGYNGILNLHPGTIMPELVDICEQYGMYIATSNDPISTRENTGYDEIKDNPYFAGEVWEDETVTASAIAQDMVDHGVKTVALHGFPFGLSSQMDLRLEAAEKVFTEAGVTVLPAQSFDKAGAAKDVIDQHPEIDAIFSSVETVSTVYQPLNDAGLADKVLLNCYEPGEDALDAFKDGTVNYLVTGTCADSMIAFLLLYNAMTGNRLSQADGSAPSIQMSYLLCKTPEEYEDAVSLCSAANPPYTYEELKQFIGPDATFDALKEYAQKFSLEDLKARAGK